MRYIYALHPVYHTSRRNQNVYVSRLWHATFAGSNFTACSDAYILVDKLVYEQMEVQHAGVWAHPFGIVQNDNFMNESGQASSVITFILRFRQAAISKQRDCETRPFIMYSCSFFYSNARLESSASRESGAMKDHVRLCCFFGLN